MKMEKQMNDTNKLNGNDGVRLLKVFPQFAQYCNWEKLSRKKWKWDLANVIAWILLMPCSIIGYMIYRGVF